jgi:hypothetical protein
MDASAPIDGGQVVDSSFAIDAGPVPELCDGSNTVRLRYGIIASASREPLGVAVQIQNGLAYWVITGNCHYYVMSEPWSEVHEGNLDRQQAQEIATAVSYGRLHELRGRYSKPSIMLTDGATVRLGTATDIISCYGPCETGSAGLADAAVQAAIDYAYDLIAMLNERGAPVSGPIRISVVEFPATGVDFAPEILPIEWPLSMPIEEVSIDVQELSAGARYMGSLVTRKSDVRTLRRMRDSIGSGEFGTDWSSYRFFWIGDGPDSPRNELRFRDVIPLEDDDGNIQMEFDPIVLEPDADGGT